MDKRYQVFLSSTYNDLSEQRAAVIQIILGLDHLPAGMEMFPAANEDQWTLIKRAIDESDYYIVVVGGRYGSMNADGISYTEREYDYAIETKTPVLGFLHKDPDKIESGKTDQNDEAREKLAEFRKKVEGKPVKYFTSAAELGDLVATSLVQLTKTEPGIGWVRGDKAMTVEIEREIIDLRERLAKANADNESAQRALVEDTSVLAQGRDQLKMNVTIRGYHNQAWHTVRYENADTTWDDLFADIGPLMIDETTETAVRDKVAEHFMLLISNEDWDTISPWSNRSYSIYDDDWHKVQIQYRALGLIDLGTKRRPVHDRNTYLRLTALGDQHLVYLRAIRREDDEDDR